MVGLNVLLSPTLLFSRLYFEYTEVLSTETWLLLSTAGSPLYHQKFTAFIFAQVALNTCLFLFSICIVQQFFEKKKTFPEHYFIMLLLLLVLFMLDILAALLIFPNLLFLTLKSLYFTLWGMLSAAFFPAVYQVFLAGKEYFCLLSDAIFCRNRCTDGHTNPKRPRQKKKAPANHAPIKGSTIPFFPMLTHTVFIA